jgi:uncharacterized protein (TIGR02466 family)
MSTIQGSISNWFPVQFAEINAPEFIEVGQTIFKTIEWAPLKYDKYNNNAETTYYDNYDLPAVKGLEELKQVICSGVEGLASGQGVNIEKHKAIIQGMWMSNMRKGSTHIKHAHGNSMYCGTYYVQCPKGSGSIRFYNPCAELFELTNPPIEKEGNAITSAWVDFKPKPGLLLLWNSWVFHEVLKNHNTTPRISISFNVVFIKR